MFEQNRNGGPNTVDIQTCAYDISYLVDRKLVLFLIKKNYYILTFIGLVNLISNVYFFTEISVLVQSGCVASL